jgi:dynactin complex subunit
LCRYASSEAKKADVWVGIMFNEPIGKHGGKVNGIR